MEPQAWIRETFKASLQAMCQPAEVQLSLYPDGCVKTDELANDFAFRWEVYRQNFGDDLTPEQIEAVNLVDSALDTMSVPRLVSLWTEESLASATEWKQVRDLAKVAISSFGWPESVPETHWF